jgi:uncharacterized repeat protein (TIGR03803 family)
LTPTLSGPWTETTLHDFTGLDGDGSAPSQPLAFDRQGNIYGTTDTGGISNNACPNGCGTLFELTPVAGGGWNYSVSYSFGKTITDAEVPDSPVIFDALGNLYGCSEGGTYGYGTVFELTPGTAGGTWTESILYNFQGGTADGAGPDTLVFDSAGHLYGTTASGGGSAGYGTVFELTRSSSGAWTETLPLLFDGKNGEYPDAFVRAPRGEFFGLTSEGGKTNDGVVFEFRP